MTALDRWVLSATITTTAPLSIRTGIEAERPRIKDKNGKEVEQGSVNLIECDCMGDPFIPGSAIKGLIRSFAATHFADADLYKVETLLGGMTRDRGSTTGAKTAMGGAAEFRNAWLIPATNGTPVEHGRTAIDRGSRTAADAMLRTDRSVPSGASFALEIIIDRTAIESVRLLRSLLALIDGESSQSSLGSGDGRVKLGDVKVQHWDKDAILAWATKGGDWRALGSDATATTVAAAPNPNGKTARFAISLAIRGHFLVSQENPKKEGNGAPDLIPLDPKCPTLPASSFDGAIRAQAERIWRTVHGNPPEDWSRDPPPAPLEELFGSRNRKGLFTPDDFSAPPAQPTRVDFVAIDRVSGGSSDGAKFAVMAFEAPVLSGAFELCFERQVSQKLTGQPEKATSRSLSPAAIGLLALTLRDMAEGDVTFGYGGRKGFGDVAALNPDTGGLHDLLHAIARAWKGKDCDATAEIETAVTAFRNWIQEPGS